MRAVEPIRKGPRKWAPQQRHTGASSHRARRLLIWTLVGVLACMMIMTTRFRYILFGDPNHSKMAAKYHAQQAEKTLRSRREAGKKQRATVSARPSSESLHFSGSGHEEHVASRGDHTGGESALTPYTEFEPNPHGVEPITSVLHNDEETIESLRADTNLYVVDDAYVIKSHQRYKHFKFPSAHPFAVPGILLGDWNRKRPHWARKRADDKDLPHSHRYLVSCSYLNEDDDKIRSRPAPHRCDTLSMLVYRTVGVASASVADVMAWYSTEIGGSGQVFQDYLPRARDISGLDNGGGAVAAFLETRFKAHSAIMEAAVANNLPGDHSQGRSATSFSFIATIANLFMTKHLKHPRWIAEIWEPHVWVDRNALTTALYIQLYASKHHDGINTAHRCNSCSPQELQDEWIPKMGLWQRNPKHLQKPPSSNKDKKERRASSLRHQELGCAWYVVIDMDITPSEGKPTSTHPLQGFGDTTMLDTAVDNMLTPAGNGRFLGDSRPNEWGWCHTVIMTVTLVVPQPPKADESKREKAAQAVTTFEQRSAPILVTYINKRIEDACRKSVQAHKNSCEVEPLIPQQTLHVQSTSVPWKDLAAAQRSTRHLQEHKGAVDIPDVEEHLEKVKTVFGPRRMQGQFLRTAMVPLNHNPYLTGHRTHISRDRLSSSLNTRFTHLALIPGTSVFIPQNAAKFLSAAEITAAEKILLAPTMFVPLKPANVNPKPLGGRGVSPTTLMNRNMFDILVRVAELSARGEEEDYMRDTSNGYLSSTVSRGGVMSSTSYGIEAWAKAVGLEQAIYTAYDKHDNAALQVDVSSAAATRMVDDEDSVEGDNAARLSAVWHPFAIDGVARDDAEKILKQVAQ